VAEPRSLSRARLKITKFIKRKKFTHCAERGGASLIAPSVAENHSLCRVGRIFTLCANSGKLFLAEMSKLFFNMPNTLDFQSI
jgi:hypothetical protein